MVTAYEAMRMGLHPVLVEASDRIGGRLLLPMWPAIRTIRLSE
jgi:NADPH-dependent 2,4-dienoyl-CoA reductase/sulfur reductase-like enzyme